MKTILTNKFFSKHTTTMVALSIVFFSLPSLSYSETTTVNQYYPAPFGVYNTIRLVPRATALPNPCDIGTLYVDASSQIKFCGDMSGVGTWGNLSDVWVQSSNSLYLKDYADPNIKVGIGLNNPSEQLEITKNMRLPDTTATAGIIKMDTDPFIHAYGTDNTFAGRLAGNLTLSGTNNTGVGDHALFSLTSGNFNTALGVDALRSNTSGSYNTASGVESLYSNTIGNYNSAVGASSLRANLSGSENTAFGFESMKLNTTGNKNSAFGAYSLYNNNGSNNTAVGYSAGYANTTGTNNTFIGVNAGNVGTLPNLTNATAIGYQAQVTASNALVLGGTGAYAVNVGVGVTAPLSTLDVNGQLVIRGGSPGVGKVLTSDGSGSATWEYPTYAP